MQSLRRGWVFVKQALGMIRSNPTGLIPSAYAMAAGFAMGLVFLLLIGLLLSASHAQLAGLALAGFLLCVLLLAQASTAAIASSLTAARIYAQLTEAPASPTGQLADLRKKWLDLLLFSLAGPGLWIAGWFKPVPKRTATPAPAEPAEPAGAEPLTPPESPILQPVQTRIVDRAWLGAAYLVIPIMGIEHLSIKESLPRAAQFIQTHALRLNSNQIGVQSFSWLVGGLLTLLGAVCGWTVYHFSLQSHPVTGLHLALFICLSLLAFDLFTLAGIIFGSYLNTVYATCLYLWSRSAAEARMNGLTEPIRIPGLLVAALEK
jgi:hypothetical protein